MKDNIIIQLSDRDHIIRRPGLYIGSVNYVENQEFVLNDSGKFEWTTVKYVPALIKIINEILDNAVDEAVRTNFQLANKIKIYVDKKSISIIDNGRGLPVKKMADSDQYMPVVAFTASRSGSNFSDDGRTTIGMNGVGAFATNCFSNVFKVDTSDGENRLSLECKDNCGSIDFSVRKNAQKYTKVYFEPDFSRFEG